jgi:hypothetical protein
MEYEAYEKKISFAGEYDVIVCGAGPSGVCAAITSARNNKKTLLLENSGCLGGYWTAGLMCITLDIEGKGGLGREIFNSLSAVNSAKLIDSTSYIYDPEMMKALLEELCMDAGVEILFNTRVTDAICRPGNMSAVVTESQAGCLAFSAKVFLDCTGGGELAARAGCSFEAGHPKTGELQPASLHALVTGVPDSFKFTVGVSKDKREFKELLKSVGAEPSYLAPLLFKLCYGNLWCLAITHQYGVGFDSPSDASRAVLKARREIHHAVSALKTLPGWESLRVVTTSEQLGLREGRRIRGLYKITADDLIEGRKHEDAVCLVRYPVDIHALDASYGHAAHDGNIKVEPYHIPYRSLVSPEINNLGMAGRCICGDFYAHASYRVIGNAAATGEALGYAAALAVDENRQLSEIDGKKISDYIKMQDYEL